MKIIKILLWTLISLAVLSGSVHGEETGIDLPVRVDGAAGTVLIEDAEGHEVDHALIGGGMEHVFRLQPVPLSECRYRVRQIRGKQKARYDTRVYDVTIFSYLDVDGEEVYVHVISSNGTKTDAVVFRNGSESGTVPRTGDESKTWIYAALLLLSAGGSLLALAGRRKIK